MSEPTSDRVPTLEEIERALADGYYKPPASTDLAYLLARVKDTEAEYMSPTWQERAIAAEREVDALREALREAYDALRCEWPGIAHRLDGTDIEPAPVPLSVAWDKSIAALTRARALLAQETPGPEEKL